jgi:hypothetical protein
MEGHREAQVVVDLFPVPDRLRRFLEAGKLVAPPELLVIDLATLNLAVLLRPARPDVPVADPASWTLSAKARGNSEPLSFWSWRIGKAKAFRTSAKNSRLDP